MKDSLLMQIARDNLDDLRKQAEVFGMDVDVETWSLVEKDDYIEATWITNWKNKQAMGDHQPTDNWEKQNG